jgi:hypothetical protein
MTRSLSPLEIQLDRALAVRERATDDMRRAARAMRVPAPEAPARAPIAPNADECVYVPEVSAPAARTVVVCGVRLASNARTLPLAVYVGGAW